jgi:hypothetical protein
VLVQRSPDPCPSPALIRVDWLEQHVSETSQIAMEQQAFKKCKQLLEYLHFLFLKRHQVVKVLIYV